MMHEHEDAITKRDYDRLCTLIYDQAGIHLGGEKKTMLEARIRRRLKALNLPGYRQYCEYLFGQQGMKEELVHLFDVVTTNKTDFFREPKHFDFLVQKALPEFLKMNCTRPFMIWSAGCSTGEEPYTMAMVLSEFAQGHPGFRFQIHATDLSTTVLEKAVRGIYTEDVIAPVSQQMKRKYFMFSRDKKSDLVRVVPELREAIEFRRLNFMDTDYGISGYYDAVFCRNVIIYFDRPTQQRILQRQCSFLRPGGYMFVGHSETLHDLNLPLKPVAPSLYRRIDGC